MEGVPSELSRSLARIAQEIVFAFVTRSELEGRHKNLASPPSVHFCFYRVGEVETENKCRAERSALWPRTQTNDDGVAPSDNCRVAVIAAFPLRPPSAVTFCICSQMICSAPTHGHRRRGVPRPSPKIYSTHVACPSVLIHSFLRSAARHRHLFCQDPFSCCYAEQKGGCQGL